MQGESNLLSAATSNVFSTRPFLPFSPSTQNIHQKRAKGKVVPTQLCPQICFNDNHK